MAETEGPASEGEHIPGQPSVELPRMGALLAIFGKPPGVPDSRGSMEDIYKN